MTALAYAYDPDQVLTRTTKTQRGVPKVAYDRGRGRFLQTDPIGYEDDLNLYAYVRNDPLNMSDPTDLQSDMLQREREEEEAFGRRGHPMDVAPGTNAPGEVGGRQYSGHAFDQMQGRGVMPSSVENRDLSGARRRFTLRT